MTILRWILLSAMAMAFLLLAVANWTPVPFRLPDGEIISIRLPILLAMAFAAGWLPTWLLHLGTKAQMNRKLTRAGVGVEDKRVAAASPVPPAGA